LHASAAAGGASEPYQGARRATRVSVDRWQVRLDGYVVGSDGEAVGQVKEVRENDFLVDRRMQRDIYVPFEAVQAVTDYSIVLTIPADKVGDMDWPQRPIKDSPPII
jgi:hypothetical protein